MSDAARVVVEAHPATAHSRARVLHPGTFLTPRPLLATGPAARIALVGVRAALCAGDDLGLDAEVAPGAALELVDLGGTVAYGMRGGTASWRARLRLHEESHLTWWERPFVLSAGAEVHREVHARLAAGAEMLWRETLVLGRTGEQGGALHARTRVCHDGGELVAEDLDLPGEVRALPGILGPNRVLGQVALLGRRPPGPAHPDRLDLAGPGALARSLADASHRTDAVLDPFWRAWHA